MELSIPAIADAELIRRLRAGDGDAVADLARAHGSRIHQLALRYLKNREDAEEITQDVLFKAVGKISRFRGDSALSSWLYRITFNTAMSRLRHLRVGAEGPENRNLDAQSIDDIVDWSALADERVFRRQMRRRLIRALRCLPAIYRRPVMLRDFRGLSTGEASRLLQLNVQTLKSRLHRGRLLLRRELADFSKGLTLH